MSRVLLKLACKACKVLSVSSEEDEEAEAEVVVEVVVVVAVIVAVAVLVEALVPHKAAADMVVKASASWCNPFNPTANRDTSA